MIAVLAIAQLIGTQASPPDSVYATAALRIAVEAAALANRQAPTSLHAYKAKLESEVGLIIVDTIGRERTGQIEQVGSTATWSLDSGYNVHVVGYRSQSAGIPFSVVGFIKGWSLPMLYGERLLLGVEGTANSNVDALKRGRRADTIVTVHPFATDRDQYYRYAGGDTVAVLETPKRRISLMRIRVMPHLDPNARIGAFDGEIDIDADNFAIVRMRGRFVVSGQPPMSLLSKVIVKGTGTVGVAYAEFVNAEYDGKYWLPVTQRIEFQASVALFSGMRSVFRIVSRFSDFVIDDTSQVAGMTPTAAYSRRRVTFAPSDSMSDFTDWATQMGSMTSSVGANDFNDVAPPRWRPDGPPRITLYPSRPDRIVHYNRIEGLYTGAELSAEFRNRAPGTVARLYGGWAWTEQTTRGGLSVTRTRGNSATTVQIDRTLTSTADFRGDLEDGGSSLGALLGSIEEVDYVDRQRAGLVQTRVLGSVRRAIVIGRLAVARDIDVQSNLAHGPVRTSTLFLPNRHAATGTYGLAAVDYLFHPNVSGPFLAPGFGSTIHVEGASGQISWVRTEISLSLRRYLGRVTLAAKVDGGALFSATPPPQQLFELGGAGILSGYRYKEFAGDRAAVFRGFAAYGFPIFRAPYRVKRFLIPGLSPGFGVGADGGTTWSSSSATSAAMLALGDGTDANAVSRVTGRVRATAVVAATFFSHSLQIGRARAIDQPGPWRWIFGLGQAF